MAMLGALVLASACRAKGKEEAAPAPSLDAHGPAFDADMIPSVDVPRVEDASAIAIDGKLDEPLWKTAATTGTFVDVGSGTIRKDLPVGGEARLFYTDEGLYVGFEVTDARVTGGFPAGAVDPHLWERDTVEIMTKPDDDGTNKDYYELQIGPQNLVFDSHFDDYNAPRGGPDGPFGHEEWKATLKSAVAVHGTIDDDADHDEGYTVEAFIAFASFSLHATGPVASGLREPGSEERTFRGRTMRMNFYAMKNNGGAAWSPVLGTGNFHKASRFGRVHLLP
jgi:hypothetical protein